MDKMKDGESAKLSLVQIPEPVENLVSFTSQEWMCLGANVIGGCCRVGPDTIEKISDAIITNIFEATRFRESEAKKSRSTDDDWTSVLDRLKKSSYADQKKQEEAAEAAFTDIGDGKGLFSRMHAQMEQILKEDSEKKAIEKK